MSHIYVHRIKKKIIYMQSYLLYLNMKTKKNNSLHDRENIVPNAIIYMIPVGEFNTGMDYRSISYAGM